MFLPCILSVSVHLHPWHVKVFVLIHEHFHTKTGTPTPCPIPLAAWERGGIDVHSGRVPYCLGIKMFRITQIKMLIFKDTAGKMTCTLAQSQRYGLVLG